MTKTLQNYVLPFIALALIAIADISISSSSLFMWGEADCPKELLK